MVAARADAIKNAQDSINYDDFDTPIYTIFAGVNGAGKSTLYRSGLWTTNGAVLAQPRVNSDEILIDNGWDWADGQAQLRAGKIAVSRIRSYLQARQSFNQETTLCGKSILKNIARACDFGYRVSLFYVGVENPQIANERIAHRVQTGGHFIDPQTVERRARVSMANLEIALPLCHETVLFDNTQQLTCVARFKNGQLVNSFLPCAVNSQTWYSRFL
jgi:predicted ABC-type ATPase